MRRRFDDFANAFQFDSGPRRVVRIRDQNRARLRANGREQLFERERKIRRPLIQLANVRARQLRIKTIHRIRGPQQQDIVAIVDVGIDEHLNRFVGAVGQ